MATADQPTGDDMYLAPALDPEPAAGQVLDPVDVMDRSTCQLLWGQEGRRLLAREDDVAAAARENSWTFTALDARLSARLVELDITDSCPRITRHVCTPLENGATVLDLTGVSFHRTGDRPELLRLQIGSAGLVNFPSDHKLAVVPTGGTDIGWRRFGPGVDTESGEFDDRYRVHCDDPLWAMLVLNPSLMQRLLDHWPTTLIITGNLLAVIRPGWESASTLPDFSCTTTWSSAA